MNKKNKSDGIKRVISELMDAVMNRVLITNPFIKEEHHSILYITSKEQYYLQI